MNAPAAARIGAYLLVALAAAGPALALKGLPRAAAADWREPLQRADAALASGDRRAAQQAWEQAYRAEVHTRQPEGLLAVGDACLRIADAGGDRFTAAASSRRIFLTALFQARERHDGAGVAAAAAAVASLGDREVADRGFELAAAIAAPMATRWPASAARHFGPEL